MRLARIVLGLVAVVFVVVAVAQRWSEVRHQLDRVSVLSLVLAGVAVLAAIVAGMLGWRAILADLGSPLPVAAAARVMLLGQLGKYVPGGVWTVVAQTELARDLGVSRRRSAAAGLVYNVLGLGTGLLLAVVSLPAMAGSHGMPRWVLWVVAVSPVSLVCIAPPVLTRLTNMALRLLRRDPLEHPFTWAGTLRAVAWITLLWLLLALHVWLLGVGLGARGAALVLPSIGGYAAASSAGFLVIFAPAGAGVRETVLTILLAPSLPGGTAAALTVALISRLLLTIGDVVAALVAHAMGRSSTSRAGTSRAGTSRQGANAHPS
jgi:glycosyltransferase 2 family protein